jgi:hypothetical protein
MKSRAPGQVSGNPNSPDRGSPARNAGALVAERRGREASSGMARGAMTVDSRTALVDLATQADPLSWSNVCCNSALEAAAIRHRMSPVPVIAYASSTPGIEDRSSCNRSSAPCAISSVTNACTGKPAAATSTSGPYPVMTRARSIRSSRDCTVARATLTVRDRSRIPARGVRRSAASRARSSASRTGSSAIRASLGSRPDTPAGPPEPVSPRNDYN